MVIRKVNNEYCVFSEDGSKKFGCFSSMDQAEKRLKQIDYFKHIKSNTMLDENILQGFKVSNSKTSEQLQEGTIAGLSSAKILDKKEHFPVITPDQAKSSMNRVMKLTKVPDWYSGSIDELQYAVYAGIKEAHPKLDLKVSVPVTVALSDGETPAETKKSDIKNPDDISPSLVPEVKRPTLGELWESASDNQLAFANTLVMTIQKQQDMLSEAMDLAERLTESGLSGEEFSQLSSFLQEDILRNLTQCGVEACRKQEILNKLTGADKKRKLDPNAGVRNRGDVIFPAGSSKVKDNKDHFEINNEGQARNALQRSNQYSSVPPWYDGTLEELLAAVVSAVKRKYPDIEVGKTAKKPGKG